MFPFFLIHHHAKGLWLKATCPRQHPLTFKSHGNEETALSLYFCHEMPLGLGSNVDLGYYCR